MVQYNDCQCLPYVLSYMLILQKTWTILSKTNVILHKRAFMRFKGMSWIIKVRISDCCFFTSKFCIDSLIERLYIQLHLFHICLDMVSNHYCCLFMGYISFHCTLVLYMIALYTLFFIPYFSTLYYKYLNYILNCTMIVLLILHIYLQQYEQQQFCSQQQQQQHFDVDNVPYHH